MSGKFRFTSIWAAVLAGVFLIYSADRADAAKVPYGHYHDLSLVFTAGTDADSVEFVVCKVTKTRHVAFVPYHRNVLGYAMAKSACTNDDNIN